MRARGFGLLMVAGLLSACAPEDIVVGSNKGPQCGAGGTAGAGTGGRFGFVGAPIGVVDGVSTSLPPLPPLQGVEGTIAGDSVKVRFSPIDGAKDYRIYALPADQDISVTGDGHVRVKNGLYRCAGARMAPAPVVDGVSSASAWIRTLVDGQDVDGYTRSLAEATLGYVYETPGQGRVPVYALGDPAPDADSDCYYARWNESRVKKYTTSDAERATAIAQGWRDDGIAFYAPTQGVTVSSSVGADKTRYYYANPAEAKVRPAATPAFYVLAAAAAGTTPLMRVFYRNICGTSHDELAVGKERFSRAYRQGNQPLWELRWSGVTAPTTLVLEALDAQCPYPGVVAPVAKPSLTTQSASYEPWLTLDGARAASPTGEVFLNGQGAATDPRPIARTFLKVAPTSPPPLDWFDGFSPGTPLAPFADAPCGAPPPNSCWQQFRETSKDYDTDFMSSETERHAFDAALGELWVGFADEGTITGGKFRLTPQTRATMTSDAFLYVTLETDTLTTARRFPQLVISDASPPIDWTFSTGRSLLVQTNRTVTASWPNQLQLQVCDHRAWVETGQCPAFADFHHRLANDPAGTVAALAPNAEVAEHSGLDRATQWEVFASSQRVYLFLDGAPYGCADLPAGAPTGSVSVTFGYVLAHSSADDMTGLSDFLRMHGQLESHRHFDNLGFKSGVAAPPWDEGLLPCARASQMMIAQ